jgi:hypothetical protein
LIGARDNPNVAIKLHEMNEREIAEALVERRWMWR